MDVFIALVQANFNLVWSKEEFSWLQNLFQVISTSFYNPAIFNKPCEELCIDVLNEIFARNGERLPLDHNVLSVSSLFAYEKGNYFAGKFGRKFAHAPESDQRSGLKYMEERRVILFGLLTTTPSSDKTLHAEAGFLYLEDNKSAIICQVCEACRPEKYMLNNFVLLPKWNFIDINFPLKIYESDKKIAGTNRLKYIEVVQNIICFGERPYEIIPQSLSLEEYYQLKTFSKKEKKNVIGRLKSFSSTHSVHGEKPYFFARFQSLETNQSAIIVFVVNIQCKYHVFEKSFDR